MSEHYFSEHPQSQSEPHSLHAILRGRELTFFTDHGVFSRRGIDEGTRLLIESMPSLATGTLLDLGCGYGAIGIALAVASPDLRVSMVDINARAVELALRNAVLNRVERRVDAAQGDGFDALPASALFDTIALNPPIRAGKQVIFRLYEEAYARLRGVGRLFVVIRKQQGAESSEKRLREIGFAVNVVAKDKGYRVFSCSKQHISD